MKQFFVAATRQNEGKTTVAVGLTAVLVSRNYRVGFIKPVGQRYVEVDSHRIDADDVKQEANAHGDDNVGVRKSLRALLESAGLAVETYASGEEFLAAYDPERPGCLVLDVRLRHGSGLDLQDDLRRRKAMLPIIVLTGHGNVPTSVRALKAGAVDGGGFEKGLFP